MSPAHRLFRFALVALATSSIIAPLALGHSAGFAAASPGATHATTSDPQLTRTLQSTIVTLDGTYSVSVRELTGARRSVDIDGTRLTEPASVMKLFAAYAILKRVDSGDLSLTQRTRSGTSVANCLRVIIHISDNLCHWDLVAMLGSATQLNAELYADGYVNTGYVGSLVGGRELEAKRTSSTDVALLMSRLENGTLLSQASNRRLVSLLEEQLWRSRVPAGVPPGVEVANKPGYLWVASGTVHTDAAIVRAPSGTYIIVVMGSNNATAANISTLSRIVYEHFNGAFSTAASYSANNLVTRSRTVAYNFVGSSYALTLPAGTPVEAMYANREWYRVVYEGESVWIHSSHLANVYDYMDELFAPSATTLSNSTP
ncbi:MAG: serine hydrolase [Microbacteriaceae bacterium]